MEGDYAMAELPDELWMYTLLCGARTNFGYRDICTISLVSRRFRRLCYADKLWKAVWDKDWPLGQNSSSAQGYSTKGSLKSSLQTSKKMDVFKAGIAKQHVFDDEGNEDVDVVGPGRNENRISHHSSQSNKFEGTKSRSSGLNVVRNESWKDNYRIRYDRERKERTAAHSRQVFRAKSRVAMLESDITSLRHKLSEETHKLHAAAALAKELDRARQAKEALKVWQPSVAVRWQKQIVEQTPSDGKSHVEFTRQEMAVTRGAIQCCKHSLDAKRALLAAAVKEVEMLTYNPLDKPPVSSTNEGRRDGVSTRGPSASSSCSQKMTAAKRTATVAFETL